ncbi:MAG: hypothetical protein KF906_05525 [Actinobacteria bacterium]|nr:hypothetical protein [Actinomycetota bacterium]
MTAATPVPVMRPPRPLGRDLPRIGLAEMARKLARWAPLFDIVKELPHLEPPRLGGMPRCRGGRPPKYPPEAYVILSFIRCELASMREAERFLAERGVWESVRSELYKRFPHYEGLVPGAKPPNRAGFHRWVTRLDPADLELLRDRFQVEAAKLAVGMGMFDPARASMTHPCIADQIIGDGSHLTAMFNALPGEMQLDPTTGELVEKRHDHSARKQLHRSEEEIDIVASAGVPHCFLHSTNGHVNENVILGTFHVPNGPGNSEMSCGLEQVDKLRSLLPGASGVMWDKAMRGTHLDTLYQWGLQGHTRVSNAPGGGPKEKLIEHATIRKDGVDVGPLPLVAINGAAHVRVTVHGETHHVRLKPGKTSCSRGRSARCESYRWYKEYQLPDDPLLPARYRGGLLRTRLNTTENDKERGLNRAEVLRPVAEGDPDWDQVGGQRSRAESMFSLLKQSWPAAAGRRSARIRTVGAHRQQVWLLTWAIGQNLRALEAHTARLERQNLGPPGRLAA